MERNQETLSRFDLDDRKDLDGLGIRRSSKSTSDARDEQRADKRATFTTNLLYNA